MNMPIIIGIIILGLSINRVSCQIENGTVTITDLSRTSTKEAIDSYIKQINILANEPDKLNAIPSENLNVLFSTLKGIYVKDKSPPREWEQLKKSETKWIEQIILSLQKRIDPTVDIHRTVYMSYPPYDLIHHGAGAEADAERKAYNNYIDHRLKQDQIENSQRQLQRQLGIAASTAKTYLSKLYITKDLSLEDQLKKAGVSQAIVTIIVHAE
jgi:hypothetical protein